MKISKTYDFKFYARAKKVYEAICKDVTPYDIVENDDYSTMYELDNCTVIVGKFSLMPHAHVYFNDGRVLSVTFDNSKAYNNYYASIYIKRVYEVQQYQELWRIRYNKLQSA